MKHMFFTCKFALRVWNECYSWFQLSLAQHRDYFKHFYRHECGWLRAMKNKIWKYVWCATMWTLWGHRNGIAFENKLLDLDHVLETIKFHS